MTEEVKGENKRLGLLIGVSIFIVALVTAGIVYLITKSDDNNTDEIKSDVAISVIDQSETSSLVESFLDGVGNFGFKEDGLNPSNIMDVGYIVSTNPANAKSFFVSRADAYATVRDYVYPNSALFFNSNVTGSWSNTFDTQYISTFELSSITTETSSNGAYLTVDGTERLTAYTDVTFTSVETVRLKTADDSSWDGSFDVSKKTFADNTMRVTLIKDGNDEWKIYAISNLQNEFLLATWRSPDASAFANLQRDFEKTGTIRSDIVDTVPETDNETGESNE